MLKNKFKKILKFFKNRYAPRGARFYYSQSGEDILILSAVKKLNIDKPSYIDIGAHHPIFGNNTYIFYKMGGKGIIVEPNSQICKIIKKKRNRDTCINAGVAKEDSTGEFYSFKRETRNTFSKEQAEKWKNESGQQYTKSSMKLLSLNTLIRVYLDNKAPDIISIDAEGYDFEILNGYDWHSKPLIICFESNIEDQRIPKLLISKNYTEFAKNQSNQIFIHNSLNK